MQPQQLMERLTRLDPLEVVGKQYREMFGRDLEFQKYLLLSLQSWKAMPSTQALVSPEFEKKSAQARQQFSNRYNANGLSEDNFIDPERGIEVEKLLRYVEIPAHRHGFIEIVYVLSGQCRHTVAGKVYMQGPGCLTFLNPHVTHELRAEPNCLCLTTKIRGETFLDFHIPNMPYFAVPVCFHCGDDTFMRDTMLYIYQQQETSGCYHGEIISYLYQALLTYCMQNYRDTMDFLYSSSPLNGRMLEITNYMFENYQTITLRGLAQHMGYSESYLCRLFKSSTGQNFSTIVRTFKLDRGQKLLQTTDLKLEAICEAIGYSDVNQFIRDYKKQYQITPAKHRKQFRQENTLLCVPEQQ